MVQKSTPIHPWGVIGAPYYVFSKYAILGSVPVISSEALARAYKNQEKKEFTNLKNVIFQIITGLGHTKPCVSNGQLLKV